jgi:hypothetical protein
MEFKNFDEAQKFCDEIHKYLLENRKGYSASKWSEPIEQFKPNDDLKAVKESLNIWIVPIPEDYIL